MRKVFLDDLPRKKGIGANKDKDVIDWFNSVGMVVNFSYDDIEGYVEIVGYTPKGQYLTVKYQDKEFKIKSDAFARCKLGNLLNKYTNNFKFEIGSNFDNYKRDLTIIDREYRERNRKDSVIERQKWYRYKCNKCMWDNGWIEESKLYEGKGCACCSSGVVVEGINDVATTDPHLLKYFLNKSEAQKYTRHSLKKVVVKCPDCGKEKSTVISDLVTNKKMNCTCGDSFSRGHKYIHELLLQLNLDFVDNYRPRWCKYYNEYKKKDSYGEYDFIIDSVKLIIEVDGDFHRQNNSMSGQTEEESKYMDDIKDKLAKENGYEVIRIPYGEGEFKENILNSDLSKRFDLSKINWAKCEAFSLSNLVKKVCDYWNSKEEWETTTSLSTIFNLHRDTIRNYLKRGNLAKWCTYNAKQETIKNNNNSDARNKNNCKKVSVFKNEIFLGEFKSVNELERNSETVLGIKLLQSAISGVCTGKYRQYKGFTFKYVE